MYCCTSQLIAFLNNNKITGLSQDPDIFQQGGSGLAYMEPKALIGSSLPRGPRLSAAVHHIPVSTVNARMSFCPTGSEQGALSSRAQTTIINGRKRSSMPLDRSKRTMLSAQMESDDVQTVEAELFDPLGLSSGMSSSGEHPLGAGLPTLRPP